MKRTIKIVGVIALLLGFGFGQVSPAHTSAKNEIASNQVQSVSQPVFEKSNIILNNQGLDVTDEVKQSLTSESSTIIIKFKSNNQNALQSLFGISNKDKGFRNNYFDIFLRNNGNWVLK
ncbi:sialidase domain-containing protein [Bacillus sp. N9]